jgi:hypothetical protein
VKFKPEPVTLAQSDALAIDIQELEYQKHFPAVEFVQFAYVYALQTDFFSIHDDPATLAMQPLL